MFTWLGRLVSSQSTINLLATLLGLAIVVLSLLQFFVNSQKDRLSDVSAKKQEEAFNRKVANVASDAIKGLNSLEEAKFRIVALDRELAKASADTTRALQELRLARENLTDTQNDLNRLKNRSERIATLRMRVEIVADVKYPDAPPQQISPQILSGVSMIASYVSSKYITLQSSGGYVIPISSTKALITTTADANENELVGKDVSALEGFGFVALDLPDLLKILDPDKKYVAKSIAIYVVVNGASLRVINWEKIDDEAARTTMTSFNAYGSFHEMKRRYNEAVDRK